MFSPERILDRGRLLIGLLVVAPLGVLAPAIGRPAPPAPAWSITATTPNPIGQDTAPTARDVLAKLTNDPIATPGAGQPSLSSAQSGNSAPVVTSEVGSESRDQAQQSVQIPGTAPNAALAARLRQSQAQNAPVTPAPTTLPGAFQEPLPVATPSVAAYPRPQGATHVFPVVGGATFTNDWGVPRAGGQTHKGIDLFAATGTPVVAVSDGMLFRVGSNPVGGWRFWLRDSWGNEFYYAHLSAFAPAAREGANVRAGTVVGFVGNTGDAKTTPPHVHFEVHPDGGAAVAPFPYVSAWPSL